MSYAFPLTCDDQFQRVNGSVGGGWVSNDLTKWTVASNKLVGNSTVNYVNGDFIYRPASDASIDSWIDMTVESGSQGQIIIQLRRQANGDSYAMTVALTSSFTAHVQKYVSGTLTNLETGQSFTGITLNRRLRIRAYCNGADSVVSLALVVNDADTSELLFVMVAQDATNAIPGAGVVGFSHANAAGTALVVSSVRARAGVGTRTIKKIGIVGDSHFANITSSAIWFPTLLRAIHGYSIPNFSNAAVSGSNTAMWQKVGGSGYYNGSLNGGAGFVAKGILANDPTSVVILMLMTNDTLTPAGISTAQHQTNMAALIASYTSDGYPRFILPRTPYTTPSANANVPANVNDLYDTYQAGHIANNVNGTTVFLGEIDTAAYTATRMGDSSISTDGVHLTNKGQLIHLFNNTNNIASIFATTTQSQPRVLRSGGQLSGALKTGGNL